MVHGMPRVFFRIYFLVCMVRGSSRRFWVSHERPTWDVAFFWFELLTTLPVYCRRGGRTSLRGGDVSSSPIRKGPRVRREESDGPAKGPSSRRRQHPLYLRNKTRYTRLFYIILFWGLEKVIGGRETCSHQSRSWSLMVFAWCSYFFSLSSLAFHVSSLSSFSSE